MAIFRFFKMAAAAILNFKFLKFERSEHSERPNCITMPNFVEISQTVAEIWRFFRFSKMAAAAILNIQNFKFLTVGQLKRVEMRRHAKFG